MRVGCQLAGQRITLRADDSQMAVFDRAGCCCARCRVPSRPPGGTGSAVAAAPQPFRPGPAGPITGQRRVSSRGGIQVVRQRIQVGVIRLVIDGETVAVAARAASSEIHRYMAYATHRGRR